MFQALVGCKSSIYATLLVGAMENKNKLVEWKAFIGSLGIKSVDLEDEFLPKTVMCLRVVRRVKVSSDWFG